MNSLFSLGWRMPWLGVVASLLLFGIEAHAGSNWRTSSLSATLKNDALEAKFQAGFLRELKDVRTGEVLIGSQVSQLSPNVPLFGPKDNFDLDKAKVKQDVKQDSLTVVWQNDEGTEWTVRWSIEPGSGDLILQNSAKTSHPVDQFVVVFQGCDIAKHDAVWVDGYGVGHVISAPWEGTKLGNPNIDEGNSQSFPPLALFQSKKKGGWFLEGRDPTTGPASCMLAGYGGMITAGLTKRIPLTTQTPEMYEIRIRSYQEDWEDAVDPFVTWMEEKGGFVPIDKKPQQWIKDVETQAYVPIGDYDELEALAKRVDPKKTLVGRQAEFRYFGFDEKFPDYRVRDDARKWFKRARELGFHVGAHFNCRSVAIAFPELIERFKPGFQETGVDKDGNVTYESIYEGPNRLIRVSPALKDWRTYFTDQLADAVDSGVDVLYLDESMGVSGKYVVDGIDAIQGLQLLMKEILERYPNVAIKTEQFNMLTAKHGAFALSQMPLGHPLSGYLFRKFVKVVPEGVMYSPIDNAMMDAFDSWGYMLPGASPGREKSWMEIAEAYQKYSLVPDARLPRVPFTSFISHYSSGLLPVQKAPIPAEGIKLFGFHGKDGVTAFFEKKPDRRGLVIYEPGKEPQWVGTRYTHITSYAGPGMPEFFSFRYTMKDWIIYNDRELMGLDPNQTYWFNESLPRRADRFHVTGIPDDYVGITDANKRIPDQEIGAHDNFFNLVFSGNGPLSMYVPDDYDVYLNGQPVTVDRRTKTARVTVSKDQNSKSKVKGTGYVIGDTVMKLDEAADYSHMLAVRRLDLPLQGYFRSMSLISSADSARYVSPKGDKSYFATVGGIGRLQGKFPAGKKLRLKGAYSMAEDGPGPAGDGVIRINGEEIVRIGAGERPYQKFEFDVDISQFAGKFALVEFISDGLTGRSSYAEWFDPRIEVE